MLRDQLPPKTTTLLDLPNELILELLLYLGIVDLVHISMTNKFFREMGQSDILWKNMWEVISQKGGESNSTWRQRCIEYTKGCVDAFNLLFYYLQNNLSVECFVNIKFDDLYDIKIVDPRRPTISEYFMDDMINVIKNQKIYDVLFLIRCKFEKENHRTLTILHWAILLNQLDRIQAHLQQEEAELTRNVTKYLHKACKLGHEDMVNLFLKKNIFTKVIESGLDYDTTPLMLASKYGHVPIVKSLINAGANVNAYNQDHRSAIYFAAQGGHLDVLKVLYESGALLNSENDENNITALMIAIEEGHRACAIFLIENGSSVSVKNFNGETTLNFAATNGDLEIVKLLLDKNVDVNNSGVSCGAVLTNAVFYGHTECVKTLLEQGADVTKNKRNYPLFVAAQNGFDKLVEIFLNILKEDFKCTYSVYSGEFIRVASLRNVESQAKLFSSEFERFTGNNYQIQITSFEIAVIMNHTDVVRAFALKVRNLQLLTSYQQVLVIIAISHKNTAILKVLDGYGVDFSKTTLAGVLPLNYACNIKFEDGIKIITAANNRKEAILISQSIFKKASGIPKNHEYDEKVKQHSL